MLPLTSKGAHAASSSAGGTAALQLPAFLRTAMNSHAALYAGGGPFIVVLVALNTLGVLLSLIFLQGQGCFYVTFSLLVTLASFLWAGLMASWIMARDDVRRASAPFFCARRPADVSTSASSSPYLHPPTSHSLALPHPQGTPEMNVIASAIREGAEGFLRVQYTAIFRASMVVSAILFFVYLLRTPPPEVYLSRMTLALLTVISFLLGAVCSGLAGYVGVWISVRANVRVAAAASHMDFANSLLLAFRGGAFSAAISAAMCILGLSIWYIVLYALLVDAGGMDPGQIPFLMVGYGFGASFVALIMQLGGGIYTKAADVGADLVGKLESSIPEDDPRNPAVIADLVGDNVGDCAGSMADVFESIAAEILGTMILGGTLAKEAGLPDQSYVYFALIIHAFDLIVSIIGIMAVRPSDNSAEDPMDVMKRGYIVSLVLAVVLFFGSCRVILYVEQAPSAWFHFALCGVVGLIMAYFIVLLTGYYTDYKYGPVQSIAQASTTGHGTNVISGVAVGMESVAVRFPPSPSLPPSFPPQSTHMRDYSAPPAPLPCGDGLYSLARLSLHEPILSPGVTQLCHAPGSYTSTQHLARADALVAAAPLPPSPPRAPPFSSSLAFSRPTTSDARRVFPSTRPDSLARPWRRWACCRRPSLCCP